MKIAIFAFGARNEGSDEDQVMDCIEQLSQFMLKANLTSLNIIALNFFLSAENKDAYIHQIALLESYLPGELKEKTPIAYLAQAPADGSFVSVEIHYIANLEGTQVIPKNLAGNKYLLIRKKDNEKLIIANGIRTGNPDHEIPKDAENVFDIMEKILHEEGMNFDNIFRQWNYIQDITYVEQNKHISSQHYQIFNNIRSKYYSKAEFKQGYPSATGIGTRAGGVIVSFYALSQTANQFYSLENPFQRPAFEYPEEVLVGNTEYEGFSKCTPKFARAKLIANSETEQVFISGTASIRLEQTVGMDDIVKQTEITIENILKLISPQTLAQIKRKSNRKPSIDFIRVYIKNPEEFSKVRNTCSRMLPGIPAIYVVSDVCRENLLVEIEAIATLSY